MSERSTSTTTRVERLAEAAAPTTAARIGVDVVDVAEWGRCLEAGGDALLHHMYTPREVRDARGSTERLAARLAGKEASMKVLGAGFDCLAPTDVEIVTASSGQPTVQLHGRAAARSRKIGVPQIAVSLSHDGGLAAAVAISTPPKELHDDQR